MNPSVRTLGNIIDMLPLVLARRYVKEVFGVNAANEVISEIEQLCEPDYFVGESGLLLRAGVTNYPLPSSVRQIKGLYEVPAGDVVPDKDHAIDHSLQGNTLRLAEPIALTDDDDITGTVPASPPSDLTVVYDTAKFGSTLVSEDELAGRLVKLTHAAGTVEYRVLKGNTPDDFTADINGELAAQAAAGDTYLITSNFLIIEHTRYLSRFPSGTVATVIDLPQDFEYLFRSGLFFKYNSQADTLSKETTFWKNEYAAQMGNFVADTTKIRGTSVRNSGRSLPSLFT